MTNNKRVLIVDDDEMLRNGMRGICEGLGFVVDEAEDGLEAKKALVHQNYFLVVSDVEMPVMDGLALLEFVKKSSTARFLMISEFSSSLQTRQALQLGADGFLNKPFSKSDFARAIDAALVNGDVVEGASLEAEFVQVPLTDFITGTKLKVDVYIRMSASKYLKIGHKEGAFSPERVKAYMAKGIRWFYMRKEDFASYVGFNIDLAQAAHNEKNIENGKKVRLTMHVTQSLIEQLTQGGLQREQLEDASNVVMNAVELISMNVSTLKLLESVEVCGSLPSHSIAVAVWACLIARKVEWAGQSTFFKLAVSALFHDVGQKEMAEELTEKQRFELTKQERKALESHTFRGRDILQSVPGMPEDAAIVALQHHEMVSGGGYPYSLKSHQIHPFARLISVADNFCELIKGEGHDKKINYTALYKVMTINKRDYDPIFLEALGDIVVSTDEAVFNETATTKRGAR